MASVTWDSVQELEKLRREMESLIGKNVKELRPLVEKTRLSTPGAHEETASLIVKADLPGMTKDDVIVTAKDDTLTIYGYHREETVGENDSYHRRERQRSTFLRKIMLPIPVDAEKAQAQLLNGILTITMPISARPKNSLRIMVL